MIDSKVELFRKICKDNGKKFTLQRFAVYKYICDNNNHPVVEQVWDSVRRECPSTSRESVYRILNEFVGIGLLNRMDQIEIARYDTHTCPHGHLICQICGSISDFELEQSVLDSTKKIDSDILHVELRVTGICNMCKQKQNKEN